MSPLSGLFNCFFVSLLQSLRPVGTKTISQCTKLFRFSELQQSRRMFITTKHSHTKPAYRVGEYSFGKIKDKVILSPGLRIRQTFER